MQPLALCVSVVLVAVVFVPLFDQLCFSLICTIGGSGTALQLLQ